MLPLFPALFLLLLAPAPIRLVRFVLLPQVVLGGSAPVPVVQPVEPEAQGLVVLLTWLAVMVPIILLAILLEPAATPYLVVAEEVQTLYSPARTREELVALMAVAAAVGFLIAVAQRPEVAVQQASLLLRSFTNESTYFS
jgi:hypothetical protein